MTVTAVDGRRLSLRQLRGRPVAITFWVSWCVPCQEELPLLDAARRTIATRAWPWSRSTTGSPLRLTPRLAEILHSTA